MRALIAAGIMLAPEPGAPAWVLLSDPDHVGTGVPLLLLLLLIDRPRASRWVPVAAFVLLTWASIADPLAEAIGALPLAAVCLARVAVGRPRSLSALRTYWYELSLAAAAVLAALATKVADELIPALGGYSINKGVSGLIPLGEIPGNGPLVLRSVLALFGASFQDAARGRQHAINLAFAAVHLAGLALVVAAVVVAAWGLARTLAWLARARARRPGRLRRPGRRLRGRRPGGRRDRGRGRHLRGDVLHLFKLNNIYAAHEIGPVLSLGAALAGRRFGGPLARACGLRPVPRPAGTGRLERPGRRRRRRRTAAAKRAGGTAGGGATVPARRRRRRDGGRRRGRAPAAAGGGRLAPIAVLTALTALLACYCSMLGFAAAQQQTPPANAALAVWLQQHGLRSGLAGYWEASVVTVETEGAITMGSVTPLRGGRLAPRHWEQDMRIFDPATHRADFVVLAPDSPMSEPDVLRTFGPAAHVYRFETYTILVWGKNLLPDLGPAIN